MNLAVAFAGYAILLATMAPRVLRAAWTDRSPRLAIAAWQTVTASVVLAAIFVGLALAAPTAHLHRDVKQFAALCIQALHGERDALGGTAQILTGAVISLAIIGRIAFCLGAERWAAARQRRRHRETLALIATTDPKTGATVVEHSAIAAYCLPGRHRMVVITSGAMNALDDRQLQAVLGHERAHLRGRHDLVVAGALALERAFPRVAFFRHARTELTRLIELLADDAASTRTDRRSVATALVQLADAAVPGQALAASGGNLAGRVLRLLDAPRPLPWPWRLAGALAIGAMFAAPTMLAIAPGAVALVLPFCAV
jgi:Zn-dependent protease with chaperone function